MVELDNRGSRRGRASTKLTVSSVDDARSPPAPVPGQSSTAQRDGASDSQRRRMTLTNCEQSKPDPTSHLTPANLTRAYRAELRSFSSYCFGPQCDCYAAAPASPVWKPSADFIAPEAAPQRRTGIHLAHRLQPGLTETVPIFGAATFETTLAGDWPALGQNPITFDFGECCHSSRLVAPPSFLPSFRPPGDILLAAWGSPFHQEVKQPELVVLPNSSSVPISTVDKQYRQSEVIGSMSMGNG
ncbi:hypothetical protein AXG93_3617s1070 [Marchantia polymorpha subsp. ruderalis]|uniref:Uncharacterized protein n=1 Tax=Marchantia polymorpha subsp. ruderalis TaxID=1480154 RepID=A0A176WD61_MARPO|nr:hypothetical protein AXG93_3617s1070 [Marchantia polymorpha subsp. ruderalis]